MLYEYEATCLLVGSLIAEGVEADFERMLECVINMEVGEFIMSECANFKVVKTEQGYIKE